MIRLPCEPAARRKRSDRGAVLVLAGRACANRPRSPIRSQQDRAGGAIGHGGHQRRGPHGKRCKYVSGTHQATLKNPLRFAYGRGVISFNVSVVSRMDRFISAGNPTGIAPLATPAGHRCQAGRCHSRPNRRARHCGRRSYARRRRRRQSSRRLCPNGPGKGR
jgi:hypothetical protein